MPTWGDPTVAWGSGSAGWGTGGVVASPGTSTFTADAAAALRRSHVAVTVVDVLHDGAVVYLGLPVSSGSVSIAARRPRRRTVTVTVADRDGSLAPRDLSDLLAPVSAELRVKRGVEYPDGTVELWPLGVFRVDQGAVAFKDGLVTVTGYDRSIRISRNRWLAPRVVTAGTVVTTELAAMAADRYPGLAHNIAESAATVDVDTAYGETTSNDPWQDMQDLGLAAGLDVFFDGDGVFTVAAVADGSGAAAFEFVDGADGTVVDGSRTLDGADLRNGVVVYGEAASGARVVGEAWDLDPGSATYAGDPIGSSAFGARPYTYENRAITSQAQADDVASVLLGQRRGLGDGVTFTAVPDPRVDVERAVRVRSARAGVDRNYVLDAVTVGLAAADVMTCTTRVQRT